MPQQLTDRRDQEFVIWEQMNCAELLQYEKYKEFNQKTCDMIITEARALAIKELLPLLAEGDAQGVRYENGEVNAPTSDPASDSVSSMVPPHRADVSFCTYISFCSSEP